MRTRSLRLSDSPASRRHSCKEDLVTLTSTPVHSAITQRCPPVRSGDEITGRVELSTAADFFLLHSSIYQLPRSFLCARPRAQGIEWRSVSFVLSVCNFYGLKEKLVFKEGGSLDRLLEVCLSLTLVTQ